MSEAPNASIQYDSGYPVFVSQDSAGTQAMPSTTKLWNPMTNKLESGGGFARSTLMTRGRQYQVGSGATTTSIPIQTSSGLALVLSSAVQSALANSRFIIVIGTQQVEAVVTAVSASGTLTLDSALPSAPAQGTEFVLIPPEQTSLMGSNTKLVTIRSFTVPAGAFQQLSQVDCLSPGYKRVTCSLRADVAHSMELYVTHIAADGSIPSDDEGRGTTNTQTKYTEFTVKSSRTQQIYKNADMVSHVINSDVVWWVN